MFLCEVIGDADGGIHIGNVVDSVGLGNVVDSVGGFYSNVASPPILPGCLNPSYHMKGDITVIIVEKIYS